MGAREQFTKDELRYLKRKECFLCESRLDRFECAAIFKEPCTQEFLANRARTCLKSRRQRKQPSPV